MKIVALDDFLSDGILIEKEFRKKINEIKWTDYSNKNILIKGCSKAPIPTWAYLIVTSKLTKYARAIYFGEVKGAIQIYKNY